MLKETSSLSSLIYYNNFIISAFEYAEANDMPKGVMQRMTRNSFSSREITLHAHIYATVNDFFLYLYDCLFQ